MAFPSIIQQGSVAPGLYVPQDYSFYDDFTDGWGYVANATLESKFSEAANRGQWLVTVVDGGGDNGEIIRVMDAQRGGVLEIHTNDADNDSVECQLNGESFAIAANKDIYFAIRMALTAAVSPTTTIDWFVGLATTDTTVLGGVNDRIGFQSNGLNAGTADIYYVTEDDTNETTADTGINFVDATMFEVAFHVIGTSRIKFYVNGSEKASVTANIPDSGAALTPTLAIQNNAAAVKQMRVDYILAAQTR